MAIKVPPGQSPPFETIDNKHRAGIIIITAAIGLVISLVCLLIRVYVRMFLSPPWGSDDIILLGATVFAITESIVIFHAASIGFGTDISLLTKSAVDRAQNSLLVADILYLLTLYLSKCCIIAIYLRLTPRKRHRSILWGTFGFSTLGSIASVLIIAVDCEGKKPWAVPGEQCHNLPWKFIRWQAITALDNLTEIFIFAFSIALVRGLQMHISHKTLIIVSFAGRLPLVVFSALRLSTLKSYTATKNPTLIGINHTFYTQLHLNYALIACTVFCLNPFMKALTTYYGTAGNANLSTGGSYGYGYRYVYGPGGWKNADPYASGRPRDYEMKRLKERPGRVTDIGEWMDIGDETESRRIFCEAGSAHSGDSTESTRMIIRKEVEYSVTVRES